MILVGFSLSSSQLSFNRPVLTFKALVPGFQFFYLLFELCNLFIFCYFFHNFKGFDFLQSY